MSRVYLIILTVMAWAVQAGAQEASGLARYLGGAAEERRGAVTLTLDLSQGVPWRVFTLTDPARLVLDFREVDWDGADTAALAAHRAFTGLRAGGFRPGWSRLVAGLATPMEIAEAAMTLDPVTGAAALRLRLQPTGADRFAALSGTPATPGWTRPREAQRMAPPEDDTFVIMLDPGHGGIDPGAERGGVREANLMLQFARDLRDVLIRAGLGEVRLTREGDHFVSLEARIAAAQAAGADLFISLHADALSEGVAHGASVYTLSDEASDAASAALAERHERDDLLAGIDLSGADDRVAGVLLDLARLDNGPRSAALARHVVAGIENAVGQVHKRPLRQAGFSVLKAADIPSILIELGFLSTDRDLQNLQDPAWRAGMAAGIRDGIAAWKQEDAALSRLRRQ